MAINARLLRATLACAGSAALLLAATPTAFAAVTPVTGPNPPGPWVVGTTVTPGAGQVVWTEDFSNQDSSSTALSLAGPLGNYTGASGEQYTAGTQWLPPAAANASTGACNGWVLTSSTANPDPGNGSVDAGCSRDGGLDAVGAGANHPAWWFLRRMVEALGTAQGLDPATNAAVSSESNSLTNISDTMQFQQPLNPTSAAAQAIPGHYYIASIWLAAVHCPGDPNDPGGANQWTAPIQTISLTIGGSVANSLTPTTQVCDSGNVIHQSAPAGQTSGMVYVHVLRIVSTPILATSAGALGMTVEDMDANYRGNDLAFDTPTIIDVTPKLDKQISADGSAVGTSATSTGVNDTATLTFTVTNAYSDPQAASPSVLDAKLGWSFTDTLPTGMTVASVPAQDPTDGCSFNGAPATVDTSTAGVITLTGDLVQGQQFCTIKVDVKVSDPGTYVNGSSAGNFGAPDPTGYPGLSGLWPPADATLTVPAAPVTSTSTTASPPPRSLPPTSGTVVPVVSSNTGGSVNAAMVLWPMLALIVTGLTVWFVAWLASSPDGVTQNKPQ